MGRRRKSNFDLPERVYRDGIAYWYRPRNGAPINLGRSKELALEKLQRIGREPTRMHEGHLKTIFWNAQKNARSRKLNFSLSKEDVLALWARSGGRCELTLIPFDLVNVDGFKRRPYAPSIDRIDGSKGYAPGNCRLVTVVANLAINEWGEDVFARVARAYLKRRATRKYSDTPHYIQAVGA